MKSPDLQSPANIGHCRERSARPLSVSLPHGRVTISRFRGDATSEPLHVGAPVADTFFAIHQLRDFPAHDFWIGGRYRPAPASPRGSTHIIKLADAPCGRIHTRFDSLHVELPRRALDDLARELDSGPIDTLETPEAWATIDERLQQLAPVLVSALDGAAPAPPLVVDHLVLAAAAHLASAFGRLRPRQAGGLAPWQEARARERIAADLGGASGLADIARECGLSPCHFARSFRLSTGMTPHEWLQTCRLARARELLLGSRLSLAEIAVAAGFADQSHFTRMFRRAQGAPPGAWRRGNSS